MLKHNLLACAEPPVEVGRWSAVTMIALLCGCAAVVGGRWLAGALTRPLQPGLLVLVGAVLVGVVVTVRTLWHRLPQLTVSRRLRWAATILPSAAMLILGVALSVRGTSVVGLLAFWGLVAGEEFWAWRPWAWREWGLNRGLPSGCDEGPSEAPSPPAPLPADGERGERPSLQPTLEMTPDLPLADGVVQQLTRSQTADGADQIAGWLRMPFAAGQRTASAHVAFCPPFLKTPRLAVEQSAGPPARIKTSQLLPYGARFDLKLAAAADGPTDVVLRFTAETTAPSPLVAAGSGSQS